MSVDDVAREIASDLFKSCGRVPKADRLVLWDDTRKREIAGWCEGAVVDRVAAILTREQDSLRAEVERLRELAERAIIALHMDSHLGIPFAECRKKFCGDWHALNAKGPT